MRRVSLLVLCAVSLGGCDGFGNMFNGTGSSMSGAGVVLRKPYEAYTAADLAGLIVASTPHAAPPISAPSASPSAPATTATSATQATPATPDPSEPRRLTDSSGKDLGYDLNDTIGWFSMQLYAQNSSVDANNRQNAMRDARNEIQGMLLTASANRCNAFKLLLRERSTNTNFILGSMATAFGAAGAIVTGGASQALAGAAAAASGTNSEFSRDILSNVTSTVIIPGIDKQRSAILQEINNRRCFGVSSYSLTDAMLDAVRYHTACSTDVGVSAAGAALSQTNTTGTAGKTTTVADVGAMVDQVKALEKKMTTPGAASSPANGAGTGAADGGATPPAQAGAGQATAQPPSTATTAPSGGTSTPSSVLVGDTITYQQCSPLDASGAASATGAQTTTAATPAGTTH